MTQDERDVINAAKQAVVIQLTDKMVFADLSKDAEAVGRLVRAVVKLSRSDQDYWRER